jgi:Holliday junction resolvase RusA-like endonuclease
VNQTYKVSNSRFYKSKEAKDWEKEAGWIVKGVIKGQKPLTEPLSVAIRLFLGRDRDLGNSQKLVMDLLESIGVYKNDKQIESMHLTKWVDKKNPRIEIIVDIL